MNLPAQAVTVQDYRATRERAIYIKDKRGDLVGGNHVIPKADFAHFLGYKQASAAEKANPAALSGGRQLELMLRREFEDLGKTATQNGDGYRNLYIAGSSLANEPGRVKDMLASGFDAMQQSVEMGHATSLRYLEMQYKFQWAGEHFGAISNLMKVRNESVKKTINEIR